MSPAREYLTPPSEAPDVSTIAPEEATTAVAVVTFVEFVCDELACPWCSTEAPLLALVAEGDPLATINPGLRFDCCCCCCCDCCGPDDGDGDCCLPVSLAEFIEVGEWPFTVTVVVEFIDDE